ncbi:hypothetical protein BGZ83_005156 [Gryganskiella cystojenkinii]|nr:hypothetical protein BGZ83_005156 [Gryganskiella cystojenkinii]
MNHDPEEVQNVTYLDNASNEIEAQFQYHTGTGDNDQDHAMDTTPLEGQHRQRQQQEQQLPEQDYEWVEESEYIILDFGASGNVGKDMASLLKHGYSLIGMDTPNPYFRAGGRILRGLFDESAFTEDLLFDMTARKQPTEPTQGDQEGGEANGNVDIGANGNGTVDIEEEDVEENMEALELVGIVTKRVVFENVDLVPRLESESINARHQGEDDGDVLVVGDVASSQRSAGDAEFEREHGMVSISRAARYAAGASKLVKTRPSKNKNQAAAQTTTLAASATSPSTQGQPEGQSGTTEGSGKKATATRTRKKKDDPKSTETAGKSSTTQIKLTQMGRGAASSSSSGGSSLGAAPAPAPAPAGQSASTAGSTSQATTTTATAAVVTSSSTSGSRRNSKSGISRVGAATSASGEEDRNMDLS